MKSMMTFLAIPAILFLAGCSGSSSHDSAPLKATSLAYEDPRPTAGEWALVKDPTASTPTRIVLSLLGPTGSLFRGVGFNLKADAAKVAFSRFKDPHGVSLGFMLDQGVLHDLDTASQPVRCMASIAGMKADILSVGIWQKCQRFEIPPEDVSVQPQGSRNMNEAMDCSTTPVLKVALELAKNASPGDTSLAITKAAIIPNHGKKMDLPLPTTIRVGTLKLK